MTVAAGGVGDGVPPDPVTLPQAPTASEATRSRRAPEVMWVMTFGARLCSPASAGSLRGGLIHAAPMEDRQYADLAANDLVDGTVIADAKLPISAEGSSERSSVPLGIHRKATLERTADSISHVRGDPGKVVLDYLAVVAENVLRQREATRRRRVRLGQIASCGKAIDGS